MRFIKNALILCSWAIVSCAGVQNYCNYHRQALVAYEYRLVGDHRSALALFKRLENRYCLMPTEAYAMGYSYCLVGDTARARTYFTLAAERGANGGLMDADRDSLIKYTSIEWFTAVNKSYFTTAMELFPYIDGPNGTVPTETTRINRRYQTYADSLMALYGTYGGDIPGHPESKADYERLLHEHDAVLDSMIKGRLSLPTIQRYGMNGEFELFTFHVTPSYLYGKRRQFKKWLRKGYIYPRVYANCFDEVDRELGERMTYGVLLGNKEGLKKGFSKRRKRIGMGREEIDSIRFCWR